MSGLFYFLFLVPSANSFEETEWFCSSGKTFFALAPTFAFGETKPSELRDVLLKNMASTKNKNSAILSYMEFGLFKWARKKEAPVVKKEEPSPEQDSSKESPEEEVLRSREKSSSHRVGKGICNAEWVELKDDGKGIFKTSDYKAERAAYLVDRFLGFNFVPPTVIREFDGETGSIQRFVPDAKEGSEFFDLRSREEYSQELMKLWLFDLIIGNRDRHDSNFLIKGKHIFAIDHGRSFGWAGGEMFFADPVQYRHNFRDFWNEKLPVDLIEKFQRFLKWPEGQSLLRELTAELIGSKAADNLLKRINRVGEIIIKKKLMPRPKY